MNTMNYEKKYKEAVKAIKELSDSFDDDNLTNELGIIFPELKESEDERIRKELLEHCINRRDGKQICVDASDYRRWAAWLEKQGEKVIDCPQNHQDVKYPNGCIVLEDFNGGEGFYKLNLDYLNKKQVEEIEELVRTWNTELNPLNNENIRVCIGMCLADSDEQRFKDFNTSLKDCLSWLEKQDEQKIVSKTEPIVEGLTTEFQKQVSYLIASAMDKEHNYTKGYVEWVAQSLLGYAKNEHTSTDKVEPKFKVGDTIVEKDLDNYDYETIKDIKNGQYIFTDGYCMNIDEQEGWQLVKTPTIIEQKHAWSEEDEKMFNDAICAIWSIDDYTNDETQEIENWLKSLKKRMKGE